ncbi:hypothetical protein A2482_01435 [Candidatus Falkowbacteria bacterium RIFOXYC2_FULL_48_21]|uniref:Uncharacterized protein n=1 Tax=Candidatus Falkowbacteria bacterium RIFOXYC2_FULL_48_21 TaxID=1798005 RepID=A0A1F5T6G3_9BACT|nr:MAG: hypothetical protein A2482_01435 [Candidatus Falkowbacteria bacterium RIFOXYC2_FULL_48_21]
MISQFVALLKMKDLLTIKGAMPALAAAVSELETIPELTQTSDGRELLANWRWLAEATEKVFDCNPAESLVGKYLAPKYQEYFVMSLIRLERAKQLESEGDCGFNKSEKIELVVKSLLNMLFEMNDYYVFSGLVEVGRQVGY